MRVLEPHRRALVSAPLVALHPETKLFRCAELLRTTVDHPFRGGPERAGQGLVDAQEDDRIAVELDQAHEEGRAVVEALQGAPILLQALLDAPLLGHVRDGFDPSVGGT